MMKLSTFVVNDALGPFSSTVGVGGLAVMMAYTVVPLDVYLEKKEIIVVT